MFTSRQLHPLASADPYYVHSNARPTLFSLPSAHKSAAGLLSQISTHLIHLAASQMGYRRSLSTEAQLTHSAHVYYRVNIQAICCQTDVHDIQETMIWCKARVCTITIIILAVCIYDTVL